MQVKAIKIIPNHADWKKKKKSVYDAARVQ
jgi:hypothetical protein